MSIETSDPSVGTPLENGAAAVSHTVGAHYTQATAADAGEAIALNASELAAVHDIVDPESGCVLDPDEAVAVAREENEGNTMVVPPRIYQPQEAFDTMHRIRRIQEETILDPEGPTGA